MLRRRKMKMKELFKCTVFCFTLLFLNALSIVQAGEFTFVTEWGDLTPTIPTIPASNRTDYPESFTGPAGMAIDDSGTIYIADNSNQRVEKYDSDGNFIAMLTECPDISVADIHHCSDPGEIKGPVDVALDPTGEYVYVVSGFWNMISKFNSAGTFILSWGYDPVQNNVLADFMREPAAIAVDDAGDVYVTDIGGSVIWKFDSEGYLITMWTHPYATGDDFRPTGIALGENGVYITDYLNSAVHHFGYNGQLNDSWGGYDGAAAGEFTYPAAVDVDAAGNIFVADALNNRIQALSDGWTAYEGGIAEGSIARPFGIVADSSGNVYVADTWNHRVLKYAYTPTP
jgi:DNA-binding beta-propeller fold protein YncE